MSNVAIGAVSDDVSSAIADAYGQHAALLTRIAVHKFRIEPEDAQTLVHDVFLSFMLRRGEVLDVRAWLVGAICNASRHYHRRYDRLESLPEDFEGTAAPSHLNMERLVAGECLSCATPRCRLALRLRYVEGYSMSELAEELGTTTKYAEKIVRNCLKQAQRFYGEES